MWGGVIDYNIIHEIHRKIQENTSTIKPELGGWQYGLEMQPATYRPVTGKEFNAQPALQNNI